MSQEKAPAAPVPSSFVELENGLVVPESAMQEQTAEAEKESKPARSAFKLAEAREGGQSMAMEQKQMDSGDGDQVPESTKSIRLDTDPGVERALDGVMAYYHNAQNAGRTPEANNTESDSGQSAKSADLTEKLRQRRAMSMSPSELAAQRRLQGEQTDADAENRQEWLRQLQEDLAEIVLDPKHVQDWREHFRNNFAKEDMTSENAKEYIQQRVQQLGGEDIGLQQEVYDQLHDIILMNDEDFSAYMHDYHERHGVNEDDMTEEAKKRRSITKNINGVSSDLIARAQTGAHKLGERLGVNDENGEKKRYWKAAAVLGSVALAAYVSHKIGESSGMEQGMEQAQSGFESQIEGLEDTIENQQDEIDRNQATIENLQEELGEATNGGEEGEVVDVSSNYEDLPEGYLIDTPEGYEVNIMHGGETDSFWRAAEHSLRDTLGREPSTKEINQLQNNLGNHWLNVGDKVVITDDTIDKSLRAVGTR